MALSARHNGMWRTVGRLGVALMLGAAVWVRGAQISDVVVRCSVPDLEPESLRQLVLGSVQSLPGSQFNAATLSEDVKRLYRLGTFQDVRYEVEEQAGDKVLIIFLVKPTPSVNKVVFEGNSAYKDRRLRSLVEHKEGVPLDEAQVAKDKAALVDRYEEGGYHGTTVTTEYRPVADTNAVDIVFRITETPRAKLKAVRFTGNTAFEAGDGQPPSVGLHLPFRELRQRAATGGRQGPVARPVPDQGLPRLCRRDGRDQAPRQRAVGHPGLPPEGRAAV